MKNRKPMLLNRTGLRMQLTASEWYIGRNPKLIVIALKLNACFMSLWEEVDVFCVNTCVCVGVCMCVWHVWLVLCMQVAGKGVPAWPDIPKQQGNQLGNLTPADRHGSVQVSQMWTPRLIVSEESGRLQTLIWVVTPCCLMVDMNISEERAAFVSESQDAVGWIGWVQWRANKMLPKPVETVNITIYWYAVGSLFFLHFTDLISYSLPVWHCSCQNWGWRQHMPP